MSQTLKIGLVCSSGGATAIAAKAIFDSVYPGVLSYVVATDRECGIEGHCAENNLPCRRFNAQNGDDLSRNIAGWFATLGGVDCVLLFFSRIVGSALFSAYPTFNIHPSLLPAFQGFQPVRHALQSGVRVMGATLHMADNHVDGGPIVAQTFHPLPSSFNEKEANSLSFCQKTYLCTLLYDLLHHRRLQFERNADGHYQIMIASDTSHSAHANPALSTEALQNAYQNFIDAQNYAYNFSMIFRN